ncbi:MAG: hypothetical protein ACJAZ2_000786 [Glaciecola sp.]|jgi:hypothetical protein
MELKFGKTGAVVSVFFLLVIALGVLHFGYQLYLEYQLFPDLIAFIVLAILGYLMLKPSFLSYSVLSFSKDHKLTITRPFYKIKMFENAIQKHTLDLKEVEKVLVVIPERPSAPANYLFFMKGNTGIASLILFFDEKEGESVKKKLKGSKVPLVQSKILNIKYDSMLGLSTLT